MNAPFVVTSPGQSTALPSPDEFRSQLIEIIALVERWAVERLRACQPPQKVPLLLGQKIEAVRRVSKDQPQVFGTHDTLLPLLDKLRPYIELRSSIGHATTKKLGGDFVLYEETGVEATKPWIGRTAVHRSEFGRILKEARNIHQDLKARAPARACAPPQPKPGAAAGP